MGTSNEESESALDEQKLVSTYGNAIGALYQTRLEVNKQLLTLSTLAIGLLVGILGKPSSNLEFFLWCFASAMFVGCMILNLWKILLAVETYKDTIKIANSKGKDQTEHILRMMDADDLKRIIDRIVFVSFSVGSTSTVILAFLWVRRNFDIV